MTFTAVLIQSLLNHKDIVFFKSFKMFGFNELIMQTRRHSDFLKNFMYYYYDVIHVQHISVTREFHRAYCFY